VAFRRLRGRHAHLCASDEALSSSDCWQGRRLGGSRGAHRVTEGRSWYPTPTCSRARILLAYIRPPAGHGDGYRARRAAPICVRARSRGGQRSRAGDPTARKMVLCVPNKADWQRLRLGGLYEPLQSFVEFFSPCRQSSSFKFNLLECGTVAAGGLCALRRLAESEKCVSPSPTCAPIKRSRSLRQLARPVPNCVTCAKCCEFKRLCAALLQPAQGGLIQPEAKALPVSLVQHALA